jgi:hypothetical protein
MAKVEWNLLALNFTAGHTVMLWWVTSAALVKSKKPVAIASPQGSEGNTAIITLEYTHKFCSILKVFRNIIPQGCFGARTP